MIEDGLNGLLCDGYSPESIVKKVKMLLTDTELWQKISKYSIIKRMEYSPDLIAEKFYKVCRKIRARRQIERGIKITNNFQSFFY